MQLINSSLWIVFKSKIKQSTYLVSTQQRRYRCCFSFKVFLQGGVMYGIQHYLGTSKPTFIYYLTISGRIVYNFILTQACIPAKCIFSESHERIINLDLVHSISYSVNYIRFNRLNEIEMCLIVNYKEYLLFI